MTVFGPLKTEIGPCVRCGMPNLRWGPNGHPLCEPCRREVGDDSDVTWTDEEHTLRARLEAGDTVVVTMRGQHRRLIDWAQAHRLFVRVDRETEWGNPFKTPDDGDRETVIANFQYHYLPFKPSLMNRLHQLKGKALACWCAPRACHGDALKVYADAATPSTL